MGTGAPKSIYALTYLTNLVNLNLSRNKLASMKQDFETFFATVLKLCFLIYFFFVSFVRVFF